ncbi:hypothetical protein pb186bvf_014703 [Paramecium bursaria]
MKVKKNQDLVWFGFVSPYKKETHNRNHIYLEQFTLIRLCQDFYLLFVMAEQISIRLFNWIKPYQTCVMIIFFIKILALRNSLEVLLINIQYFRKMNLLFYPNTIIIIDIICKKQVFNFLRSLALTNVIQRYSHRIGIKCTQGDQIANKKNPKKKKKYDNLSIKCKNQKYQYYNNLIKLFNEKQKW